MVNIQCGQMLRQESFKVEYLKEFFPQGSILELFLICINDLPENLVSNCKLFADDTSLFSVIRNKHLSAQNLNEDLNKINHWASQ